MKLNRSKTKNVEWIDIPDITREQGEFLQKKFGFHPLDIQDCLSIQQTPKIDTYDKYIFMILHFPGSQKGKKRIAVREIAIFITDKTVITIRKSGFNPIESLFQNVQTNNMLKKEFMSQGTGYLLYKILKVVTKSMFPVIDKLGELLAEVEKNIYEEETRDAVMDLAEVRREVLALRRIVTPQKIILQTLINTKKKFLGTDPDVYFGDILDSFERAIVTLISFHDLVKAYNETNESLISHKTNDVMRMLTIISVSLLPLTLLSGIYGMNITGLPWANHPGSFWIIAIVMILIISGTIFYFRKKDWI